MSLLATINSPADVKALDAARLPELADDIRAEIIGTVAKNGGHLASSLGTVELTIGLCRVFDPPADKVVWDVGHQTYAWKLLTGRRDRFATLRQAGGLSGFSNPEESPCDAFISGHAGVALSAAEGMAVARDRAGAATNVVAVVGDAALTNGISLEALNDCTSLTGKLVLVLNDNEMSISKNVGAFARHLGRLLTGVRYNRVKAAAERAGHKLRLTFLRGAYHRLEQVIKSFWLGNAFFESFGLRYIGPIDGHDLKAVIDALTVAKTDKRSVVVHVVTVKGRGFRPAENDPTAWHGVGPFDPDHPRQLGPSDPPDAPVPPTWSECFGTALVAAARRDPKVAALTAAMRDGTGLDGFAREFPARFFDVGICEGHLVSFAAGLASSGLKPVVAVYSTFLQRAVDNVMHDVCLLNLPVVLAVDRAGVVGADGRTHHGVFDIAMLRCLPNISILQPKDAAELRAMLDAALARGGPVVIRYPRGRPPAVSAASAPVVWGKAEIVRPVTGGKAAVWIWALGDEVPKALAVADRLAAAGLAAGVVNARFAKPLDGALLKAQADAGARFVTIENGSAAGGFGSAVREAFGARPVSVASFGWPDRFMGQGSQAELDADAGLSSAAVADVILKGGSDVRS